MRQAVNTNFFFFFFPHVRNTEKQTHENRKVFFKKRRELTDQNDLKDTDKISKQTQTHIHTKKKIL